jgi:hypothetical protein
MSEGQRQSVGQKLRRTRRENERARRLFSRACDRARRMRRAGKPRMDLQRPGQQVRSTPRAGFGVPLYTVIDRVKCWMSYTSAIHNRAALHSAHEVFSVWSSRSGSCLARYRRFKDVTSTRLTDCVRCYVLWASSAMNVSTTDVRRSGT